MKVLVLDLRDGAASLFGRRVVAFWVGHGAVPSHQENVRKPLAGDIGNERRTAVRNENRARQCPHDAEKRRFPCERGVKPSVRRAR